MGAFFVVIFWVKMVKYGYGVRTPMLPIFTKLHWTEHAKLKMRQYGLSKSKLMNIISKPERKEEGIAEGTTAVMKTNKTYSMAKAKKPLGEIWLMYQDNKNIRSIISAWRYPGVSKPGESIPMPADIRQELMQKEHGIS